MSILASILSALGTVAAFLIYLFASAVVAYMARAIRIHQQHDQDDTPRKEQPCSTTPQPTR